MRTKPGQAMNRATHSRLQKLEQAITPPKRHVICGLAQQQAEAELQRRKALGEIGDGDVDGIGVLANGEVHAAVDRAAIVPHPELEDR